MAQAPCSLRGATGWKAGLAGWYLAGLSLLAGNSLGKVANNVNDWCEAKETCEPTVGILDWDRSPEREMVSCYRVV